MAVSYTHLDVYKRQYYNWMSGKTSYDEFLTEVQQNETINTDWFDILTRDAYSQTHNLSMSGGSEKVCYYASFGISDDNGVAKTSYSDRYSITVSYTHLDVYKRQNLDFSQSGQIGGFSWRIDPQIGSVFNQLVDKLKSSKNQRTLEDDDDERLSYTDYLNGTIPIAGHPINGFYSYKFKGLDPTDGRPMFYGTEEENKEAYGKLTKEQLYKTVMEYSGCRQPFLQGGISSTMQWRRVVFSFNLSYSFGAKTRLIKLYSEASETGGTMACLLYTSRCV